MCCFSQSIRSVSQTNIFARTGLNGRQYLVYSMRLDTPKDVAMILPIPVKAGSTERALRFFNLEKYPEIFTHLNLLFPPPPSRTKGAKTAGAAPQGLAVQQVGSFEASFVPTVRDFSRLDARFRLPDGTWDQLPQYKNYGFAVFKLKPGAEVVHPMAFSFPRADLKRLFFPTVHIHDGKVHATAGFDHALYCQRGPGDSFSLADWRESERFADSLVQVNRAQSIVISKAHVYLKPMRGRLKNQDAWVG